MKKYALLTLVLLTHGCIADLSVDQPVPSEQCEPEGLDVLLEVFPSCDLGMCGEGEEARSRGRCVDDNQLGPDQLSLLAPCANADTPQHCVPVALLVTDGLTKPTVCESLGGAEGRCMSLCVPQIQEKKDQLPQDICEEGTLCAPCYDPFTGESTGACDASVCDMPEEPPHLFAACCEGKGGGNCVPRVAVPDESEESLGEDVCADPEADVCVPTGFDAPDFVPPSCTRPNDDPGVCLPTCIPLIDSISTDDPDEGIGYKKEDCPEDHQRCIPCTLGFISDSVDGFCGN
jgi:hypothetical protein